MKKANVNDIEITVVQELHNLYQIIKNLRGE